MLEVVYDDGGLSEKLKIFGSGLGGIYNELLKEVGKDMTAESKSLAPVRTGRLRDSINFIVDEKKELSALTTRKKIARRHIWYANIREHGANISARRVPTLIFKINGEWKRAKSVKTPAAKPSFMKGVFEDYFGDNGKGYGLLAAALEKKANEELT